MTRSIRALMLISLLPLLISSAQAQKVFKKDEGLFTTGEIKTTKRLGAERSIMIRSAANLTGKLIIRAAATDSVSLTYAKLARARNLDTGTDFIDLIGVSLETVAQQARLELRAPNPAPWQGDVEAGLVEATLEIPRGCHIEIDATYFDIEAVGPIASLVVQSSLGGIDVTNVTEKLDIVTANRRVQLKDVSGDINVATSNSSLLATNIAAVEQQARFRNTDGDIAIDQVHGSLNIRNEYGRINITDWAVGDDVSFVRGSSGPIQVEITEVGAGRLIVNNEYEDIEFSVPDTVSAIFSLVVEEESRIEATNLLFQTDLIERDRLNLRTRDGRASLSGSIRGKGNIFLRGIKGNDE